MWTDHRWTDWWRVITIAHSEHFVLRWAKKLSFSGSLKVRTVSLRVNRWRNLRSKLKHLQTIKCHWRIYMTLTSWVLSKATCISNTSIVTWKSMEVIGKCSVHRLSFQQTDRWMDRHTPVKQYAPDLSRPKNLVKKCTTYYSFLISLVQPILALAVARTPPLLNSSYLSRSWKSCDPLLFNLKWKSDQIEAKILINSPKWHNLMPKWPKEALWKYC